MSEKLIIFNNLTRSKLPFVPVKGKEVKFYSCGPTTYDFLHVGNARALIVGDLIHRIFKVLGYKVNFVRNFTDVDDKIINRANELEIDALTHSKKFIEECLLDMNELGMIPATHTPTVSETMPEIIAMIEEIINKGYGYEIEGEIFYHVPLFKEYGKLSKKKLDQLEYGRRVDVDSKKKHPADFVLWKPEKKGEPSWDSPWGKGRPGWHIECSAMSRKFLGETIDVHHGGVDLMFPHHENEIAQSEAASGKTFCNYWCHNEYLNFGKEKMSKSLGNVVTIRQFTEKFGGIVLRQMLLSAHYRTVMEWSESAIKRGISDVERIHKFLVNFKKAKEENFDNDVSNDLTMKVKTFIPKMKKNLAGDFNVPGAAAHFFSMVRMLNKDFLDEQGQYLNKEKLGSELIKEVEEVISFTKDAVGMIHDDPIKVLENINKAKKNLSDEKIKLSNQEVEELLVERNTARSNKDWAKADEIRDKFTKAGIILKDNPDGTVSWQYK